MRQVVYKRPKGFVDPFADKGKEEIQTQSPKKTNSPTNDRKSNRSSHVNKVRNSVRDSKNSNRSTIDEVKFTEGNATKPESVPEMLASIERYVTYIVTKGEDRLSKSAPQLGLDVDPGDVSSQMLCEVSCSVRCWSVSDSIMAVSVTSINRDNKCITKDGSLLYEPITAEAHIYAEDIRMRIPQSAIDTTIDEKNNSNSTMTFPQDPEARKNIALDIVNNVNVRKENGENWVVLVQSPYLANEEMISGLEGSTHDDLEDDNSIQKGNEQKLTEEAALEILQGIHYIDTASLNC